MQSSAEEIVKKYSAESEKNFNASNAAAVAIDPKTGQILVMVGSRDYFDKVISGNFNVATAKRQPGSTFKPFVYATAFDKGYTPETVLFDLPTQFQTTCTPDGKPINKNNPDSCYSPQNYDGKFLGPINLRNALAQSRNIPAIKLLYLAGIKDSLRTAKNLGITSLTNPDQYGLTLVLGGGEVSLLEMTNAYAVFANEGVRNPYTPILRVEDAEGKVLEGFVSKPETVMDAETTNKISSILSDNEAKAPAYGANSLFNIKDRPVASKTGTTNDNRDAWVLSYTPNLALGVWMGNNDNSPMVKKTAGLIVSPMWRALMDSFLPSLPKEYFNDPLPASSELKPVFRGIWQGNETQLIDKRTGQPANENTPEQYVKESVIPNVHEILYWVDKDDPYGPAPTNPERDPQFKLWEYPLETWLGTQNLKDIGLIQ